MTNSPEMSVNTSMNVRTSSGSVGKPGLGSTTSRTAPMVGNPAFAPVAVSIAVSLTPRMRLVNTLGWKPCVSSR
jgi:hypothetical protein